MHNVTNYRIRFNRLELAGSLGDLGTLLPLAMGMILINGLNPSGLFFTVGLFYILSGFYFRITMPVQPMKVVGAYAVATALSADQIMASALILAVVLALIGISGAIDIIDKHTPKSVIRGVQLSTGVLLMSQGIKCMLGTANIQLLHQMAEPYLQWQRIGPVPMGILLGIVGLILALLLLDNAKLPAALAVIGFGLLTGILLGTHQGFDTFSLKLTLPSWLSLGVPARIDITYALFALVLPQLPMTVGNAVLANKDLAHQYFGKAAQKVTNRALCLSMALANALAFILGGMPLCHGAGGLAAHYRFGARTAGSNLIIGTLFIVLVVLLGNQILTLLYLIPFAVLGVLLFFAGGQLALTITATALQTRSEMFVALTILGITLAANLAVGFLAGLMLALVIKQGKLSM